MEDKLDDMTVAGVIYVIHCPEMLCLPPSCSVRMGSANRGGRGNGMTRHWAVFREKKRSALLIGGSSLPSTDAAWFLSVARQQLWGIWRFHGDGLRLFVCVFVAGRGPNVTLGQNAYFPAWQWRCFLERLWWSFHSTCLSSELPVTPNHKMSRNALYYDKRVFLLQYYSTVV